MTDNPSEAKEKATAAAAASVFTLSNRNRRKKVAMKAAAIAALDAATENGRPAIEVMMEMTGEPAVRCAGYLNTSPDFSGRPRDVQFGATSLPRPPRPEPKVAEAPATAPACSGPLVQVRRHFDDWRVAQYRLSDISGLHWDDVSGGVRRKAPRSHLHGYVLCNGMVAGEISHSCCHGPPPHEVKVCITKGGNEEVWALLTDDGKSGEQPEKPAKGGGSGERRS